MNDRRTLTSTLDGRAVVAKRATTARGAPAIAAEADRLAAAAHPGVVRLVARCHEPHEGFATAWVSGRTLQTFDGPLAEALRVLVTVCETLAELHGRRVVHGRLDPSHVLVADGLRGVLCGFGADGSGDPCDDVAAIGEILTSLTGTGSIIEPIPDHRWRRRDHDAEALRRTVQTLADQATNDDPDRRPSALLLGSALDALASPVPSASHEVTMPIRRGWAPNRRAPVVAAASKRRPVVGANEPGRAAQALVAGCLAAVAALCGLMVVVTTRALIEEGPGLSGRSAYAWLETQDTASLMAFVVQVTALATCAYLVATTSLAGLGNLVPASGIARVANSLTPRLLRASIARIAALTLSATVSMAASGRLRPPATVPAAAAAAERSAPDLGSDRRSPTVPPTLVEREAQTTRGDGDGNEDGDGDEDEAEAAPVEAAAAPVDSMPVVADREWVVARGDHLWSIAATLSEQALGRPPSDDETAGLWRMILLRNADLEDPDVLMPGQVISIPAEGSGAGS